MMNEDVTFDVVPGGGLVGATSATLAASFTVATNSAGIATCPIWQMGATAGTQQVTARIASGTPSLVTFRARASRSQVQLPVVRRMWPPTAVRLGQSSPDPVNQQWLKSFVGSPRLELSFNVQMEQAHLAKPAGWLRVSLVRSFGQDEIEVRPLALSYGGPAASPMMGTAGEFTEVFGLRSMQPDDLLKVESRFLVQIRAANGNIVDVATPKQLLDAEFQGTRMGINRRTEIFGLTDVKTFPQDVWDALGPTGATLPQSGDGAEGGEFISWLAVEALG
ncbi:MAG: hypothetical protein H7066_04580 [Cytophagaceae bacterium]|nr:hypothetical protein [Gemmatimonadaceae bacterium]